MSKPAMLQINACGTWRNVCEFDVEDRDATDKVMEAAATLAMHSIDKPKVRVVKDDCGVTVPLMRWSPLWGWKDARC